MDVGNLSPEIMAKAKECKTTEELVELAKTEGIELSDEELNEIAGGSWNCQGYCSNNCYKEWVESICSQYH